MSALTWRPGLVAAVTRHAAWMLPPADAPPIDAARARAEQTCRARAAHAHAHLDVVHECFGQSPGGHLGVAFGTGCVGAEAAP